MATIQTVKRIRLLGDASMFGIFLVLLYVFINAYRSGDYSTTISINSYGEAHVELVLLIFILFPIFIITLTASFLDWRSTWRARGMVHYNDYYLDNSDPTDPAARTVHTSLSIQDDEDPLITQPLRCPGCGRGFSVKATEGPRNMRCPFCGVSGRVNISRDGARAPGSGNREPSIKVLRDIKR